jgi:hypothetical protein
MQPILDPDQYFEFGKPYFPDRQQHWAFYEPVFGRFLFTSSSTDIGILQEIRMLCSSRYNLILCDLQTADNYNINLIDNLCCENWAMTNQVDITDIMTHHYDYNVETLIPVNADQDPQILREKTWIQFVNYWVNWKRTRLFCNHWENISSFVETVFDIKIDDHQHELNQKIQLELYLGRDIASTQHNIIQHVEKSMVAG